jgi:hypothetical protein
MDVLESSVFYAVLADGCANNNGYINRGTVFSVESVPGCYKQDI